MEKESEGRTVGFLTDITVDGIALWVVILVCLGVFLAGLMDGIAGGGGIISLPTYLMAFHGIPFYYAFGNNKLCDSSAYVCNLSFESSYAGFLGIAFDKLTDSTVT